MSPDDLSKILDELGQRLGPAGSHVFELAVRQAIIDGALSLIGGVVFVAAFAVSGAFALRVLRRPHKKYPDDDLAKTLIPALFLVVGGFCGLFAVAIAASGLSTLLNPEYAAIRDLLAHLKL